MVGLLKATEARSCGGSSHGSGGMVGLLKATEARSCGGSSHGSGGIVGLLKSTAAVNCGGSSQGSGGMVGLLIEREAGTGANSVSSLALKLPIFKKVARANRILAIAKNLGFSSSFIMVVSFLVPEITGWLS